jgi:5-methylthioadenosine/S-adenosylhomocysteine deaminase
LRVYIHTAEGSQAVAFSLKHRGRTPIQYLADIGFLDSRVALVHACHISNEEIDQVASASTSVIHCPVSNAKTAAGLLPLRRVREAGVDVSLGTDAASSGNTNNVLVEAHFANLLHKSAATDAAYPSAEDMFCLLTVGGAKAVGAEGVIGEIRLESRTICVFTELQRPS